MIPAGVDPDNAALQLKAKPTLPALSSPTCAIMAADPTTYQPKVSVNGGAYNRVTDSYGKVMGALLTFLTTTTLSVGTALLRSVVRDSTDVQDLEWTGVLGIDTSVAGAGGIDTGVVGNSSWYAVHICGGLSGSANLAPVAVLSLSATAPTLPTGYTTFRRVGWVKTNSSAAILKFIQTGNGSGRRTWWDEVPTVTRVLNGGTSATFADVDASGFIPATAKSGTFRINFTAGVAGDILSLIPKGSSQTVGATQWMFGPGEPALSANPTYGSIEVPVSTARFLSYAVTSGSSAATISVSSYVDEL